MTFIIVLVPMLLASWSSIYLLKKHFVHDMQQRLQSSVAAAVLSYQHEVRRVERAIMAVSLDNSVKTTLRLGIFGQLKRTLDELASQYDLDFLLVTDGLGDIQVSPFPDHVLNKDLYSHPLMYEAMIQGTYAATLLEENSTLLHFLEMQGKNIDFAPIVTIEAASPVKIRDRVIGYILGGVMATGNKHLMEKLRNASDCEQVSLVAGNRIAAMSKREGVGFDRGKRFPYELNYRNRQLHLDHLHQISTPAGKVEVIEYRALGMPEEAPLIAIVCSYFKSIFYNLLANIIQSMIGIFVAGIVLALLLSAVISHSIAAPLHGLADAMGKMREQEVYETVPVRRNDEIGALLTGYNRMAATIDERISDLNREVRHRIQAERRLADESERLQVILQSIADGVIAVDIDGRIILLNRVACELTGWSNEESNGRRLEEVFAVKSLHGSTPIRDFSTHILGEDRRKLPKGDLMLSTRDGREIEVTESSAPLTDKNGKVMGAVIAFRDVSDQRFMEEELAKTKKLESLGVLAGGIAHDFNNLLTAILGNISLARREVGGHDGVYQHLVDAEKASLRARDLTLQLLTFSRGGAPVKRRVDLGELIRESAIFIARGTGVQLDFVFSDDLWPALADEGQIGQVIDNLVLNGIQAMPDGGIMTINAANAEIDDSSPIPLAPGRYIRISIEDRGVGIEETELERIFDPYFSTKQSGNGLGLTICYAIVSKHGGYIGVRSVVGKGSVFDVYLPAVDHGDPVATGAERAMPSVQQGSGRILVMDDEEVVRKVIRAMLNVMGYEVKCAEDGIRAIELYRQALGTDASFDAVIFDLTVPGGMGGEEAVARLREIDPSLKAIVSSGYSRHAIMADYKRYGFDGAVAKPYRLFELSNVLREVLG